MENRVRGAILSGSPGCRHCREIPSSLLKSMEGTSSECSIHPMLGRLLGGRERFECYSPYHHLEKLLCTVLPYVVIYSDWNTYLNLNRSDCFYSSLAYLVLLRDFCVTTY